MPAHTEAGDLSIKIGNRLWVMILRTSRSMAKTKCANAMLSCRIVVHTSNDWNT